jgi:hypothetical protein
VLSQNEAKAGGWARGAAGFSTRPDGLEGRDASVTLAALGVSIPMAEI